MGEAGADTAACKSCVLSLQQHDSISYIFALSVHTNEAKHTAAEIQLPCLWQLDAHRVKGGKYKIAKQDRHVKGLALM